ncbi:MAG: hypothetical protein R2690_15640 [Acidimicrobiales bacterium]
MAARPLLVSWAHSAAMAANARPTPPHATPNATLPSAGSPAAINPSAVAAARTRLVSSTATPTPSNGASRPMAVAPSSSARPDSSSARVWRTTRTTDSIATNTAPKPPSLIIDTAPRLVGSYTRP